MSGGALICAAVAINFLIFFFIVFRNILIVLLY